MNKIKEEFLLSVIFLLKWLFLMFGIIVILYFAISFPFEKYYDKQIAQINLELERLEVKQQKFKKIKSELEEKLKLVNFELDKLEPYNIILASKQVNKISSRLEKIWQPEIRIKIKRERVKRKDYLKKIKKAFYKLPEQSREILEDKLESLWDKRNSLNGRIKSTSQKMREIIIKKIKKRNKKKDLEVDIFSYWDIIKWLVPFLFT